MSDSPVYKILAVDDNGNMTSPISFAGLAVKYKMKRWAKPKNSTRYLFAYKTLKDAKKIFAMFNRKEQKKLVIVECIAENLRKAKGAGPVAEYRCTRLKPMEIV